MRPYTNEKNFTGRLEKFDKTETKIRMKRQGRKQMRQNGKKTLEQERKLEPFDLTDKHICNLCGQLKMIDIERSVSYLDILCYDCCDRVDQEYIKVCENLIKTIVLEKPDAQE